MRTTDRTITCMCMVTPYESSLSETFIRAQADGLPARVITIHGWRPTIGNQIVLSLPIRIFHKIMRLVFKVDLQREVTAAYVKAFAKNEVSAVLAQYGPTGVQVMEACRRLGIPFIVHFHGFDASVRSVL